MLSFLQKMINLLLQIRVLEIRVLEIRVLRIRVLQIRVLQICVLQIRVLQIRVLQIRVLQILVLQIHVLPIPVLQIQSVSYKSNPVHVLQYSQSTVSAFPPDCNLRGKSKRECLSLAWYSAAAAILKRRAPRRGL